MYTERMERMHILINEAEIRELLNIILSLFGIRAGYFYRSAEGAWTVVLNRPDHYCEYCLIARRKFADRCEKANDDFLLRAQQHTGPLWYQCYNGLHEMYLPLRIDGHDAGFIHLAQVRTENDLDSVVRECGLDAHPDIAALRASYLAMPVLPRASLEMIGKLVTVFAENIVRNRLVELTGADPALYLERYIAAYACRGASIAGAARFIGKSASYVTHMFRSHHRMPFRDYVARVRIDQAKEHLASHTIEETAALCGFKNRYHFTRVFSRITGKTPAAFQKADLMRRSKRAKAHTSR